MTEQIYYADATELAQRIAARELSPVEVVDSFLRRIDEVNPEAQRHRDTGGRRAGAGEGGRGQAGQR